jgi:hypothetical protein
LPAVNRAGEQEVAVTVEYNAPHDPDQGSGARTDMALVGASASLDVFTRACRRAAAPVRAGRARGTGEAAGA